MKNQLSKLNLRFEDLKGEKLTSEKLNEVKGGDCPKTTEVVSN